MELRQAQASEEKEIARIWHDGWHQAHAAVVPPALVARRTPEEFAARVKARLAQTSVLEIDGRLAGFVMIDGTEVYQFYVAQEYQGQGVATRLMAQTEAMMRPGTIWLACSVGNDRAARFYEKAGWTRAATEPYEVETSAGPLTLNIWRYEKMLSGSESDHGASEKP